jgi:ATP-binding cassette subfamily B protein/subfamily B ATP-binding cassette protein MsbA
VRIQSLEKGIRFSGVSFCHDGGIPVLKDIDLFIPRGSTVALVGESGAGKSTLADLILRFHDVTQGRITIDDIPIKDLSIKDLRGLAGIVDQQPVLFNDTIFNNIAFGMEGATPEAVEEAAKTANAHSFIMEKPEGYDTVVGDRGAMLSGGERQRLCIARAILRNPPLLILDEATASLDSGSEKAVREALERLMSSRTTLAIAHRLSTIRNSDLIVVLHDGRIVEKGRHEELLALGGYYRKLYEMQTL